jgi:hypothetical protein
VGLAGGLPHNKTPDNANQNVYQAPSACVTVWMILEKIWRRSGAEVGLLSAGGADGGTT